SSAPTSHTRHVHAPDTSQLSPYAVGGRGRWDPVSRMYTERPRGPLLDLVGDMQLERLIAALAPTDVVGGAAVEIRELAYDAREVPRGSLFFCIPGASVDGHDLAAEAVANGAAALVVEHPLDLSVPQLVVPSVRAAMPRGAVVFFG